MHQMNYKTQQGSALLFAFVLLIALTFIAIASVNTGVMGVRMASNVEEEMNAFQTSRASGTALRPRALAALFSRTERSRELRTGTKDVQSRGL